MPIGGAAAATSAARVRRNNDYNPNPKTPGAPPFLIHPRFVAAVPTTHVFKEKRTGDWKSVRDASGDVVFSVDLKHLTLSKRRVLRDHKGVDVGHFRTSRIKPSTKWYFGKLGDDKIGYIQHQGPGAKDPNSVRAVIFLVNKNTLTGTEDHLLGAVEGSWRSRDWKIHLFGGVAARATQGGADDSYQVEVAAGVDLAFVTMVVLALGEMYGEEDQGGKDTKGTLT